MPFRAGRALKAILTPPFRKPRAVPLEAGPLCASLSGSLAASIALGSARLDFEATPVVLYDTREYAQCHHSIGYTLPRTGERMCFGARIVDHIGSCVPVSRRP